MKLPFEAKKSLGQNFLTNPHVPLWMADAGEVRKGDRVLEIGPGTGMLTREFLKRGANVTAVETDPRSVAVLGETFAEALSSGALTLHEGDIRRLTCVDLGLEEGKYKLIANIPYYLSGILFRQFLSGDCQPSTLVFLTQHELAERIARDPKESLLSLSVKVYGKPTYVRTVTRGNFTPSPNVDSAVILITDISKRHFSAVSETFFFELLHLGFSSKRKQMLGNLSKRFARNTLTETFSTAGIPIDARAEDVPLEKWLTLSKLLFIHTSSPEN